MQMANSNLTIKNIESVIAFTIPRSKQFRNLTDQTFNDLHVFAYLGVNKTKKTMWLCRCVLCGGFTAVQGGNLASNNSKNCGCLNDARIGSLNRTHGKANRLSEYRIWKQIRGRCLTPSNKRYADYGGRGITVCEEWNDFEVFLDDVGPRPSPQHSLDRIDNDKGYSPDNCRWATSTEQNSNKRNCHFITIDGVTQTLKAWARQYKISAALIYQRLDRGMSEQEAVTKPKSVVLPKPVLEVVKRFPKERRQRPEYAIWKAMRQRCHNPNDRAYANYGGRGIKVCPKWNNFALFLADVGARPSKLHSLERIDNDGDYCPENCRWTTRSEQNNNRRSNRRITIEGRTQNMMQWLAEVGISKCTFYRRIRRGDTEAEAILYKPKHRNQST